MLFALGTTMKNKKIPKYFGGKIFLKRLYLMTMELRLSPYKDNFSIKRYYALEMLLTRPFQKNRRRLFAFSGQSGTFSLTEIIKILSKWSSLKRISKLKYLQGNLNMFGHRFKNDVWSTQVNNCFKGAFHQIYVPLFNPKETERENKIKMSKLHKQQNDRSIGLPDFERSQVIQ